MWVSNYNFLYLETFNNFGHLCCVHINQVHSNRLYLPTVFKADRKCPNHLSRTKSTKSGILLLMQLSKLENGFCYVQFRGNPAPNFKLSLRYVFG